MQHNDAVTRYEYDAFGRRSAKVTAAGRTDYLWDGNTLIGEYCQGEYRWYVFEPNSNKPLALLSGGQLYFYQLDQLGTPLSLTDSENNIVWQAHYTVFGKATVTVNNIDNPIRFQGQYYDSESGLHYNHFRYYDPQTGRFISQDPIGLLGGINHYQYAPNHINWIDPLGLSCKEECSGEKRFNTSDEAALYIMKLANPMSKRDNLEYGGLIFKDATGKYGYTGPIVGTEDGVNPFDGSAKVPDDSLEVGYWHTHGEYSAFDQYDNIVRTADPSLDDFNSDHFSSQDLNVADYKGKSSEEYKGYVGTPGNIYRGYDAKSKKQYILDKPAPIDD
ncbi:RHS repeat-associated core domain-containing protein [Rheinheimera fenheensis]|uniref:RHS repeat-associated core domain-containing protein n=1 Tax=Rheinheimera fenheensis TaxID=3152295 RepID=UPI003F7EA85F